MAVPWVGLALVLGWPGVSTTGPSATLLEQKEGLRPSLQLAMADLSPRAPLTAALWTETGGGDAAPVSSKDPTVGFVIGALAGFGLGHLLYTHEPQRGWIWLAVDSGLVLSTVLFLAVASPVGGVFAIFFGLERIVQGLDVMAGLDSSSLRFGERDDGELPHSPTRAARVFSLNF